MKIRILSVFLVILFFQACKEEGKSDLVFLGGEIVNPVRDYISLYKENELIDTIPLDRDNRFSYTFLAGEKGLYTFRHGGEGQTIYIEPGDSILFRLNTLAFDRTLTYSGEGAAKNNFLMELYLMNEKNNELILSYYKISPAEFAEKTDSIRGKHKEKLERLRGKHQFSDYFVELAKKSIAYEFYDLRERYAFLINKYFNQGHKEIPNSFFRYRKKVDFNDEQLQNSYIYLHFLDDYLKNRSIENCPTGEKARDCYNLSDFDNLRRRILLADSLFDLKVLRNRFLQRFGSRQVIFSQNQDQMDSALNLLEKIGYQDMEGLKKLARIQRSYFVGNNISDKEILSADLEKLDYGDIIEKPSLVFIWSIYLLEDHKSDHEKIRELRKKYPEMDFIGVNIDGSEASVWLNSLKKFGYDPEFEYQIRNRAEKEMLFRNYVNKIFFVNKNGEIVMGDISLDSHFLESYILEFLNR